MIFCDLMKTHRGSISMLAPSCSGDLTLETFFVLCMFVCVLFIKKKRRLAIRNAAQQWEGVRACLELPSTNGAKEEVSPENSPAHSPAQTNGLTQEPSPDEPRYTQHVQKIKMNFRSKN